MLYEKLSTINPDPNIQRALLENKAHMNSLIASIEHAKIAQTSGSSVKGMDLNDKFLKKLLYRQYLEDQEGCGVVAHGRLTEPRVTMEWLLAKPRSYSNLSAF